MNLNDQRGPQSILMNIICALLGRNDLVFHDVTKLCTWNVLGYRLRSSTYTADMVLPLHSCRLSLQEILQRNRLCVE